MRKWPDRSGTDARARAELAVPHQLRVGYVEAAEWAGPIDTSGMSAVNARVATQRGAQTVRGYRRADPLARLHALAPREITRRHLDAADHLRADDEVLESGGMDGVVRLQSPPAGFASSAGPALAKLLAVRARREAETACGRPWDVVAAVVLAGWSVARWAEHAGKSAHAARERLAIGLDLLADYYGLARNGRKLPLDKSGG